MSDARASESNIFLDHPGIVATLVAFVVGGIFVGALYNVATSHHEEGGEAGEHAAAPGASAAHGAAPGAASPGASAAHPEPAAH